ncbi:hypothetical protein Vi05172_g13040 [Venturia inaequalis]|nr:hypothetical protein Vi05172_g13040 [Venturia inaequalis]
MYLALNEEQTQLANVRHNGAIEGAQTFMHNPTALRDRIPLFYDPRSPYAHRELGSFPVLLSLVTSINERAGSTGSGANKNNNSTPSRTVFGSSHIQDPLAHTVDS